MNLNLNGYTALICGSSQGLGKSVALQLASQGCNCILFSRNAGILRETLKELDTSSSQQHAYIAEDFSFPDTAVKNVDGIMEKYGKMDILVNNAGGPAPGLLYMADPSSLLKAFNQHVIMSQLLIGRIVPGMIESGYGRIINIISVGAKQPIDNLGVSNTIRGAMMNWSKTLSKELGPFGITVNNLLPGQTMTARLEHLIESRAANSGISIEAMSREMIKQIPAGRFGTPDELANAAGFLASPAASFINGVSIAIDGGFLSCL